MKGHNKMKIYGYCRVSTKHQSIERQVKNILKEYPAAKLYTESFTGTTMQRPAWAKLLNRVKPGDIIVFDSVSRMSRTAAEGWETYEELFNKGIDLVFLKEPHINTEVYKAAVSRHIDITANTGREAIDKYIDGQAKLLNDLMLDLAKEQVQLAFDQAEKEVKDLQQRTSEGMAASGAGLKISEKKTGEIYNSTIAQNAKKIILKYSKDFNGSLNDPEVIKLAECSRNSYYKYKRELKSEMK